METLLITGMGAVTPIGIGVNAYWRALTQGVCGIGPLTRMDVSALPVQIAAEVKDFHAADHMSRTLARTLPLFAQYAFAAAEEAIRESGLDGGDNIGVVMGTALAGAVSIAEMQAASDKGHRVGPRFLPMTLGNSAAAQIAIAHDFRGPNLTLSTACSSGGDALSVAAMLLLFGSADAVVVVGGECAFTPIMVEGLARMCALSRQNDNPAYACRPFDANRDGFVMGEGGGALVLETERHALRRGAPIHAVLAGWANTADAYHMTAPRPDASGAARCMAQALDRAGLHPADIGYINAHGTSTPLGDAAEICAVKAVFGGRETAPPLSSTKSMTGHLMGAGGLTETIACVLAIRDGILPPTLHLDTPDPACDLDCVPHAARRAALSAAMSNSFGFGGQNSSVIVTRYQK